MGWRKAAGQRTTWICSVQNNTLNRLVQTEWTYWVDTSQIRTHHATNSSSRFAFQESKCMPHFIRPVKGSSTSTCYHSQSIAFCKVFFLYPQPSDLHQRQTQNFNHPKSHKTFSSQASPYPKSCWESLHPCNAAMRRAVSSSSVEGRSQRGECLQISKKTVPKPRLEKNPPEFVLVSFKKKHYKNLIA